MFPASRAGTLFVLGAFAFWAMDHGAQGARMQRDRVEEPRKQLMPLDAAPVVPGGGGIAALARGRANASEAPVLVGVRGDSPEGVVDGRAELPILAVETDTAVTMSMENTTTQR